MRSRVLQLSLACPVYGQQTAIRRPTRRSDRSVQVDGLAGLHGRPRRTGLPKTVFLLFAQRVVFLPLASKVGALIGRQLFESAIALSYSCALLRRQACPFFHPRLYPLLFGRRHLGIALCDLEPFHPSRRLHVGPILRERCEDFLMFRIELRPLDRANISRSSAGHRSHRQAEQQQKCEYYSVDW
jgi:hypothetical protein